MNVTTSVRFFVSAGRLLLLLALLALFGAWITQLTGAALLGMTQQHLFNDAMALALLGIGCFWMRSGTSATSDRAVADDQSVRADNADRECRVRAPMRSAADSPATHGCFALTARRAHPSPMSLTAES